MDSIVVLKILIHYAISGTLNVTASSDVILIHNENEITNTYIDQLIDLRDRSFIVRTKNEFSDQYVVDTFALYDENSTWEFSEKITYASEGRGEEFLNLNTEVWIKQRESRSKVNGTVRNRNITQIRTESLYHGEESPLQMAVLKYLPLYRKVPTVADAPPFILHEFFLDGFGEKRDLLKVMELSWLNISSAELDSALRKFK